MNSATIRDEVKTKNLLDAGYKVLRIRENDLDFIRLEDPNLFQMNLGYKLAMTDEGRATVKNFIDKEIRRGKA